MWWCACCNALMMQWLWQIDPVTLLEDGVTGSATPLCPNVCTCAHSPERENLVLLTLTTQSSLWWHAMTVSPQLCDGETRHSWSSTWVDLCATECHSVTEYTDCQLQSHSSEPLCTITQYTTCTPSHSTQLVRPSHSSTTVTPSHSTTVTPHIVWQQFNHHTVHTVHTIWCTQLSHHHTVHNCHSHIVHNMSHHHTAQQAHSSHSAQPWHTITQYTTGTPSLVRTVTPSHSLLWMKERSKWGCQYTLWNRECVV